MPGFFVSNRKVDIELINRFPERCLKETVSSDRYTAKRHTLNKFMLDKTLSDTEDYVLVLEGVLLNKMALFQQYDVSTVDDLMVQMYHEKGDEFFADFRGGFSGAIFDKTADKWLVFTNHAGDIPVFYACLENGFCAGTQVNYVIDACNEVGLALHVDETAAYQMLTYAFMIDDATYAKEIRRLRGGTYLKHQNGKNEIKTYFTYAKHPERFSNSSEQEIIDQMDAEFRKAVIQEYNKDIEYGYAHLSDISGGLDCRMSMWVAHDLGYDPIQLMTYSKSNFLDEVVAKQIADYWKDELLFKPLDDATFLYDIDEIVFLNGGLSLYSGISGGNRMLRSINMEPYGLEHNGICGDAVTSSKYGKLSDAETRSPVGGYSKKLLHRLEDTRKKMHAYYGDHELFLLYTRAFQGMSNTHQIRRNYTEPSAVYMNVEFAQLCLDIPVEFRIHDNIHKKWIISKYPEAAQFKWTGTGAKITEGKFIGSIRSIAKRGPRKILKVLGLHRYIVNSMVPLDYFLSKGERIRKYLDEYAEAVLNNLPIFLSETLLNDMKELYKTGTVDEKTMVLTVLAAIKLYFGHSHE